MIRKSLLKTERLIKLCTEVMLVLLKSLYLTVKTLLRGNRTIFQQEPDTKILIMGNGPSLNDVDLPAAKRAGIELACVNFFPSRHPEFFTLQPSYLILLDDAFHVAPHERSQEVEALCRNLEKIDWKIKIIVPQGKRIAIDNKNISLENICASTLNGNVLTGYLDWFYKRNLLGIGFQNVAIGAGYYFISKHVSHLYYAGLDMSEFKVYKVDEKNRIYGEYVHSYGVNRAYNDSVGPGEFYKLLGFYANMYRQFYHLSQYAQRQGVPVTNLSVHSYVDVFEKSREFHKSEQLPQVGSSENEKEQL